MSAEPNPTQLTIIYGPALLAYDFGPEHPFGAIRGKLTYELMEQVGLTTAPGVRVVAPEQADNATLKLFHTPEYIDFVQNACVRGYGFLDGGDTPAVEGGFEAAKIVVGGSQQALELVMSGQSKYAFVPVGGLHHAHPGRASGFCVFNDLAICIKRLQQEYGLQRIAYIDIDAHHGDGVVYGFYEDPGVLTVDFHEDGRYLFPGTGEQHEIGRGPGVGYKLNLPMPPYSSDLSLMYAFSELVPGLLRRFQPEFIILVAGVDGHSGDPLSDMNYSSASYLHITRHLRELAAELCQDRLIVWGAGGYSPATCALRWTEIAAALADYRLPDYLPESWRSLYRSQTGQEAPVGFDEEVTGDNTFGRVEKMVSWLKTKALL